MAYQLVIKVTSPTILSSLKHILNAMDGVTIESKKSARKKTVTEIISEDEELMSSIKRGQNDLAQGRSMRVTSKEINELLGL